MTPKESKQDATVDALTSTSYQAPVKKELLYEGYLYDVTEWVRRHPGGKIIEFYTQSGEDSTLAVQQFHQRSTKKVMAIMKSLKHRPATSEERKLIAIHNQHLC